MKENKKCHDSRQNTPPCHANGNKIDVIYADGFYPFRDGVCVFGAEMSDSLYFLSAKITRRAKYPKIQFKDKQRRLLAYLNCFFCLSCAATIRYRNKTKKNCVGVHLFCCQ